MKSNLSRTCGLLSKICYSTGTDLYKVIYSSIFHSNILYGNQLWGQKNTILRNQICNLQNKAVRIISFTYNNKNLHETYKNLKILRLESQVVFNNIIFVYDCLSKQSPEAFHTFFTPTRTSHQYETRNFHRDSLVVPSFSTVTYGLYSTNYRMIKNWNDYIKKEYPNKSPLLEKRCDFVKKLKYFLLLQ